MRSCSEQIELHMRREYVENKECTQYQSKHRNTIEGRSSDQAIKSETEWASKELMDLIEAVPYHEQFIHSFEEAMPRGQIVRIFLYQFFSPKLGVSYFPLACLDRVYVGVVMYSFIQWIHFFINQ